MSNDFMKNMEIEEIVPLALLVKGRRCLVVGAGRTACRKVLSLLNAGAEVMVVAPSVSSNVEIEELLTGESVEWHCRAFHAADVEGMFLVFAATNDEQVNAAVLAACRDRKVLCGIVDRGWRQGDFISPAVVKRNGLTLAVSTGGRSCRRAKMVKEALARHIDSVDAANILVIGVDHRGLDLTGRESFYLNSGQHSRLAAMLQQVMALHGFMLIETCNRIELHAVVSKRSEVEDILRKLLGFEQLEEQQYYCLKGQDAFRHSAFLLAGLLAQSPGEKHIVSQVKKAMAAARAEGWADGMLEEWFSSALHVSKHIRQHTGKLLAGYEMEDVCLDLLAKQKMLSASRPLMIFGSGAMGRAIVRRYLARNPQAVVYWGYNRVKPELDSAWKDRVRLGTLEVMRRHFAKIGALVCVTGSKVPIITEADSQFFSDDAGVLIVDLSVPRNVSPAVAAGAAGIEIIDLDDLKRWHRCNLIAMDKVFKIAEQIVAEHHDMFDKLTVRAT